jgi:anti-sigma B factor antagonist
VTHPPSNPAEPPTPPRIALELHGQLDARSGATFTRAVRRHLLAGERHLLVTLDDVPSLDAAGLHALVVAHRLVRRHEGTLHIRCGNPRLLRVFRLTGLAKVFTLDPAVVSEAV